MRDRQAALEAKRQALLEAGVDMMDPSSVYVEDSVQVGEGTLLLPGTILRGDTVVGRNCQIGPNVMLTSCTVEDECAINASQCEESVIRKGCQIGPYIPHPPPLCGRRGVQDRRLCPAEELQSGQRDQDGPT